MCFLSRHLQNCEGPTDRKERASKGEGGGGSGTGEGKRGGEEIKMSVSGESSEQEEMKRGNRKETSYLSKRG